MNRDYVKVGHEVNTVVYANIRTVKDRILQTAHTSIRFHEIFNTILPRYVSLNVMPISPECNQNRLCSSTTKLTSICCHNSSPILVESDLLCDLSEAAPAVIKPVLPYHALQRPAAHTLAAALAEFSFYFLRSDHTKSPYYRLEGRSSLCFFSRA